MFVVAVTGGLLEGAYGDMEYMLRNGFLSFLVNKEGYSLSY